MTAASCTAGQLTACSTEAQANATRKFIAANAEACLNKVSLAYGKLKQGTGVFSASDIQAANQACGNVYRGTVMTNGPCQLDIDCLDGLICDKGRCGNAKVVGQGAQCANIGEICPQGFYCSMATGIWVCTNKLNLGGACTDSPCLEDLRCAAGLCSVQLGIGEDCTFDQDCSTGFCEPYAGKCAQDVGFAYGNPACVAKGGSSS
jgi:hypothetical protein